MKKKGMLAIPFGPVVKTILAIVGLTIVLIFFFYLWSSNEIENTALCHNSVVLRGSAATVLPEGGQSYVPLNCKTEKICIRGKKLFEKGKCEEFENLKDVRYIDVSSVKEIEKVIADEIIECWNMMGKGKLSLFSDFWVSQGLGQAYSTCMICSRIAFDEETLAEKGINPSKRDVLGYMKSHYIPNGNISYYEYLGGKSSVSVKDNIQLEIEKDGKKEKVDIDLREIKSQDTSENTLSDEEEIAVLFMQISAPSSIESLYNIEQSIFGVTGTTYFFGGVPLAIAGIKKVISSCASPVGAVICGSLAFIAITAQQVTTIYNQGVAAGYCGDVVAKDQARRGCSVVRTLKYDADEIKNYCSVIESIP